MKLQDSLDKVERHLSQLDAKKFDKIIFEWEGITFNAAIEKIAEGVNRIKFSAKLGRLFYTIEDAAQRSNAIERLYSSNRATDGAYMITKNGEVFFHSLTKIPKTMLGNELLEAITLILLQSGAHLKLLRSFLKS